MPPPLWNSLPGDRPGRRSRIWPVWPGSDVGSGADRTPVGKDCTVSYRFRPRQRISIGIDLGTFCFCVVVGLAAASTLLAPAVVHMQRRRAGEASDVLLLVFCDAVPSLAGYGLWLLRLVAATSLKEETVTQQSEIVG